MSNDIRSKKRGKKFFRISSLKGIQNSIYFSLHSTTATGKPRRLPRKTLGLPSHIRTHTPTARILGSVSFRQGWNLHRIPGYFSRTQSGISAQLPTPPRWCAFAILSQIWFPFRSHRSLHPASFLFFPPSQLTFCLYPRSQALFPPTILLRFSFANSFTEKCYCTKIECWRDKFTSCWVFYDLRESRSWKIAPISGYSERMCSFFAKFYNCDPRQLRYYFWIIMSMTYTQFVIFISRCKKIGLFVILNNFCEW